MEHTATDRTRRKPAIESKLTGCELITSGNDEKGGEIQLGSALVIVNLVKYSSVAWVIATGWAARSDRRCSQTPKPTMVA